MALPQPVRGTQSLLGEAADRFHHVVSTFDRVRRLYGFGRVEVPVFENTSVFARSLGEATDVVSKEMYTFDDKGGDSITLRPEFTAGIARAYLSEGWQQYAPLKVATWGPAFRYERPQKGRFRQFHQLDAEIIGAGEPAADVELIAFAAQLLDELGVAGQVELQLNTLGDAATRDAWRAALVEHFASRRNDLSEQSRSRLATNPLRILDSKEHADWPIVDGAPVVDDFLTAEASDFFAAVTSGLDAAGIAWTRNARLVRGLDYYRHTAFEFITTELGAQGTVIGGGRYDGLIQTMGGPVTPAVGWASGIDRLALLIDAPAQQAPEVGLLHAGTSGAVQMQAVATLLRKIGLRVELAYKSGFSKPWKKMVEKGAPLILLVKAQSDEDRTSIAYRFTKSAVGDRAKEIQARVDRAFITGATILSGQSSDGSLADEIEIAPVRA